MMKDHESPETAFTLFLSRFEKPPRVVIYDAACKLFGIFVINYFTNKFIV